MMTWYQALENLEGEVGENEDEVLMEKKRAFVYTSVDLLLCFVIAFQVSADRMTVVQFSRLKSAL